MNRSFSASFFGHLYALLLYAYPREFRSRFSAEMQQNFQDRWRSIPNSSGLWPRPMFLLRILGDWLVSSTTERIIAMKVNLRNKGLRGMVRIPAMALGALVLCFLGGAPFLRAYVIPSGSMENSLKAGDYLLVNKIGAAHELNRGDIVAFHYPLDRGQTFVKRIIGLPGDRIRIAAKQVIRNGQALTESYAEHRASYTGAFPDNFPSAPPSFVSEPGREMLAHHVVNGEVVVPPDSLFVLGDNRDDSLDSRYWGFVPRSDVVGRPLLVYWSYQPSPDDGRPGALPKHIFSKTRWDRVLTIPR